MIKGEPLSLGLSYAIFIKNRNQVDSWHAVFVETNKQGYYVDCECRC